MTNVMLSPDTILAAVCRCTGVPAKEIRGPRRHAVYTYPRALVMFLLRIYAIPKMSYPVIGTYMHRDHSTVMSGVRKIARLLDRGDAMTKKHVTDLAIELGLQSVSIVPPRPTFSFLREVPRA